MTGYEKFLKSIGITFNFYVNKDSEKLEYRHLTGPEKLKLFNSINIHALLPKQINRNDLQQLWQQYMNIIIDLKLDYNAEDSVLALKAKIVSWFKDFLKLYQTKDVTPYMHALYSHVTQFLLLYHNIAHYTQQGMEKYNDRATKD